MINKLTLIFSIFTFSYVSAAEKGISHEYSGVAFVLGMPSAVISEALASSGPLEPGTPMNETGITRSPANPTYFCVINRDVPTITAGMHPNDLSLVIGRFGFIDSERLIARLPEPLHPNIDTLFNQFIRHYRKCPYIGNQSSVMGEASAGWFGGLSMKTLLMLNDLAKTQDELSADKKMKFLSVGAGNGLFEKMLSAVGETVAMDVTDESLSVDFNSWVQSKVTKRPLVMDDSKKNRVGDYSDMKRRIIQNNFFMPVKIYSQNSDADKNKIIEATFKDVDYANTVLVLSWPREYANPYIAHFIRNGGNTILFVRNQAIETVFDSSHLGEAIKGTPAFNIKFAFDNRFQKTSFDLNTATVSTVDLYYRGEDNPVEASLKTTISRVRMAPAGNGKK
ncbi:MAG: hypothetical protein V4544_05865 [Pseudomonadota bacterium]